MEAKETFGDGGGRHYVNSKSANQNRQDAITCVISAEEEWRETCTGAWLEGAEERVLLKTKAWHTQKKMAAHRDLKSPKDPSK